MLPYAKLQPGPGWQYDRALFYYAQRLAVEPRLRRVISKAIAARIRRKQGGAAVLPAEDSNTTAAATLRREGIAMLPGLVEQGTVARLRTYFAGQQVVGPNGQVMAFDQLPASAGMAAYPLHAVLQSADTLRLVNAQTVLRLAEDYLGCKPTLSSLGVRWSFPRKMPACDTQQFHRDPDDWRFLKFFVYLTDVAADSGPHAYVRGSHKTAGSVRGRLFSQSAMAERFGADKVLSVTGPAGTAFVADTHGFHAGLVPTNAPRLILQAQYSLLPIFSFAYAPMSLQAPADLDSYVNRLLLARQCGDEA